VDKFTTITVATGETEIRIGQRLRLSQNFANGAMRQFVYSGQALPGYSRWESRDPKCYRQIGGATRDVRGPECQTFTGRRRLMRSARGSEKGPLSARDLFWSRPKRPSVNTTASRRSNPAGPL
jgi:hypothetical protein